MAREYQIRVVGARREIVELGAAEKSIRRNMAIASRRAAEILEERARDLAPTPREGPGGGPWEPPGAGIFAETKLPTRRLVGSAPGGPPGSRFLIEFQYEIALGAEEGHVAAFMEAGTGTKRLVEYGGPREAFIIPNAFGRGIDALHPGAEPEQFLERAAHLAFPQIEDLYQDAVDRATRGFRI